MIDRKYFSTVGLVTLLAGIGSCGYSFLNTNSSIEKKTDVFVKKETPDIIPYSLGSCMSAIGIGLIYYALRKED
jgi:hypothetical protein